MTVLNFFKNNSDFTVLSQPPQLNWSTKETGIALGAHAIGHICAAFSGTVVHKIGGVTFMAVGLLGAGIVTLLDPLMINLHAYMFTTARFFYGVFEVR